MIIPAEVTAFRQTVYHLFSECFLHPPSAATLPFLADEAWKDSASALLGPEVEGLCAGLTEDSYPDRLAVEHAALFIVPGAQQTFPFETSHRENRIVNGRNQPGPRLSLIAFHVQKTYAECGMPTDLGTDELSDHAGVELRFMSLLAAAEGLSPGSEDSEGRSRIVQTEADFLNQHILQWFPEWLSCLHIRARQPFYKSGALVLKDFLDTEKATFDHILTTRFL